MKKSRQWKPATKETNHRLRSCLVEVLESFKADLVLVVEDGNFSLIEDKGSKTTEEDRGSIDKLNSQRCCRVTTVFFGKASWQSSHECSGVG